MFSVPGSLFPGRAPPARRLQSRSLRQVEHEVKPRPLLELRLHSELAAHGGDQLLADRQSKPGTRERIVARDLTLAECLEQVRHDVRRDTPPRVLHRKLYATAVDLLARHVDRAGVGELDRV